MTKQEEVAKKFLDTTVKQIEAEKKPKPVRIRLKSTGRFLEMPSRKSVWKTLGHAKAALKNAFREFGAYWNEDGKDFRATKESIRLSFSYEFVKNFEDAVFNSVLELVEFVEVE